MVIPHSEVSQPTASTKTDFFGQLQNGGAWRIQGLDIEGSAKYGGGCRGCANTVLRLFKDDKPGVRAKTGADMLPNGRLTPEEEAFEPTTLRRRRTRVGVAAGTCRLCLVLLEVRTRDGHILR